MKKLVNIAGALCLLASSQSYASDYFWADDLHPYAGVDIQGRSLSYKEGKGKENFVKNHLQGNIYVGVKFHENFGIELGYEATKEKDRDVTINSRQTNLNFFVSGGDLNVTKNKSKYEAFHLSLVGFLPILEDDLNLFGSIGAAFGKATLKTTVTADAIGQIVPNIILNFSKRETVLRVAGGAEYMFTEHVGARATLGFENTNRFKDIKADEAPTRLASLKNSFIYGVGIFGRL